MATESFVQQFKDDVHFYCQLTHPGKGPTFRSLFVTVLRNRGFWLLTFHRITSYSNRHRNSRRPMWWIVRLMSSTAEYLSAVCFKSEISGDCLFDGRVYLPNEGYLICGARSVGHGTQIHGHTTIGYDVARNIGVGPTIGKNVWIGPNCIIAGPFTIGDGATILPDTFLTHSVNAGAVVRGNPASVIHDSFDNTAIRESLRVIRDINM